MVSISLCMQPYLGLALPRPVSGPQTSLVWTVRALGSCLATLLTGAVFRWGIETPGTTTRLVPRSRVRAQHTKMVFLSASVLLVGLSMALLPWAPSFNLLLLGRGGGELYWI